MLYKIRLSENQFITLYQKQMHGHQLIRMFVNETTETHNTDDITVVVRMIFTFQGTQWHSLPLSV